MPTIMPAFDTFPQEGAIVGRLLVGYGELELELCNCVAAARDDFDMVFKAMFRTRGETQRIDIADAIGREVFKNENLETPFSEAIGAVRYCLKIRNQFAHCYWSDDFGKRLEFVEMEETAKANAHTSDVSLLRPRPIDLPTLKSQEAYFVYTRDCFMSLADEIRARGGKSPKNPFQAPKKALRPPLYKP